MILVSDAGSMRALGSWAAMIWPLVASSSSQERAAMVGGGMVCATAAEMARTLAASAAISFLMGSDVSKKELVRKKGRPIIALAAGNSVTSPQLDPQIFNVAKLAVEEMICA